MNNNQGFGEAFEQINQATGGAAGQVTQSLKQAGEAVTTDVIKGIAKTPMDMLADLFGGSAQDQNAGNEAEPSTGAGAGDDPVQQTQGGDPSISAKMQEARKKREEAIMQQRKMIAEWQQEHEKTVQEEEKVQEQEEQQEEQKKVEIKQLEKQKRQEAIALSDAKKIGGTSESMRKKG